MKRIDTYIQEKLYHQKIDEKLIVNNTISNYLYHPKDKDELIKCIKEKIDKEGLGTKDKPLDLNDIDTSKITDMSLLFSTHGNLITLSKRGHFDIADWNVSNVENMYSMFYSSNFNGDISDLDVSNVKNINLMFAGSNFDKNIADWNVSNVEDMRYIFVNCPLEKNPPKWYYK